MAVMQESIQHGGGGYRVTEYRSPFLETLVGRKYHRPFLIASVDHLEEKIGRPGSPSPTPINPALQPIQYPKY